MKDKPERINSLTLFRLVTALLEHQKLGWRFAVWFSGNGRVIVQGQRPLPSDAGADWDFDVDGSDLIDALRKANLKMVEFDREGVK